MEPIVIIKSIGAQYILDSSEYEFIKENLNKPLRLALLRWNDEGELTSVAVRYRDTIICLNDYNCIKGEFFNGIKFQLS